MEYMQVSGNNNRPGRCSDDACPCGYPGAVIEYGKGYMYIPEEVVKFRISCPTESEAQLKIQSLFGGDRLVFAGQKGVFAPILICEIGAKNRGINLDVAAKDAEHWWETGKVPLRATPFAGVNVEDVEGIAVSEDNYVIDNNGTIPISDLPIGARVTDPSWEWEFRPYENYTRARRKRRFLPIFQQIQGEVKPVTWIIVAKNHYERLEPHVTLLTEEIISRHTFDESTNRKHKYADLGYNHWGNSGTANANHGLRPWLNSTGIHSGEGFHRAFSESFKQTVLTTTVPNKEWECGSAYTTQDKVFIPSTTELGDSAHEYTYQIGAAYPYFQGTLLSGFAKREAWLGERTDTYWTRSPISSDAAAVRSVDGAGKFFFLPCVFRHIGVRPALNLKSKILVSEIKV
jgi:hypothetical protein